MLFSCDCPFTLLYCSVFENRSLKKKKCRPLTRTTYRTIPFSHSLRRLKPIYDFDNATKVQPYRRDYTYIGF